MRFFERNKKKIGYHRKIPSEYLKVLMGLSYAEDFDLPREAVKLARVYEHDMAGGAFEIRKTMGSRIKSSPVVAVFNEFPYEAQVFEAVSENYGGGKYGIYLEGLPGVITTFQFPGASRYWPNGQSPKAVRQEQQDDLSRQAADYVKQEIGRGSALGEQLKRALISKSLGIDVPELPPQPTFDEQLVTEYLEGNPEAQAAFAEAQLRKRGVKLPKEKTDFDRLLEQFTRLSDLKRAAKEFEDAGRPEPNLLRELVLGMVASVPDVLSLLIDLKANPAQTPTEPEMTPPKPESVEKLRTTKDRAGRGLNPEPELSPVQASKSAARAHQRPRQVNENQVGRSTLNYRKEFANTIDWSDLERGIHSDPVEYIGQLLVTDNDRSGGHDAVLSCLRDPDTFLAAVNEAVERLRGRPGLGDDYETAVLVQQHLSETEPGKQWLTTACARAVEA